MRTILWWTLWGLVVAIGLIALLEAHRNILHLLIASPILCGAAAAGLKRVKHEYREAVEHAKWALVTSLFLIAGLGYVYLKANAFGPFATGTSRKAFLGTTFGMSVPEVERALGQPLADAALDKPLTDRAESWVLEAMPVPRHTLQDRYTVSATLYQVPCDVTFQFIAGKLGKVEVMFKPASDQEMNMLLDRIRQELSKDYKPVADSALLFQKEDVQASLTAAQWASGRSNVGVTLIYLPYDQKKPASLIAENNAF